MRKVVLPRAVLLAKLCSVLLTFMECTKTMMMSSESMVYNGTIVIVVLPKQ
jgi:hypothetical protein